MFLADLRSKSQMQRINEKCEKYKFPYSIEPVDSATNNELLRYFHGERTGFVQVGPEKYFFPSKYLEHADGFYNFQARKDDIWVASFPRSGTTWTQELVWLIANDLKFDVALNKLLIDRFPFFEYSIFLHPEVKEELLQMPSNANCMEKRNLIEKIARPGYEALEDIDGGSVRFIKTHFPFSLLPPSVMREGSKVIYVARNPKDVAVSFYYLNRLHRTQGYIGDFARYWNYFEKGLNPWMPYFSHLKEAWSYRSRSNVLFLFYEEMIKDLPGAIRKVANFLDKPITPEGIENLTNHLKIENFRNNPAVNGHEMIDVGNSNNRESSFIRNGFSNGKGWQEAFGNNNELMMKADRWISENLSKLEFSFPK